MSRFEIGKYSLNEIKKMADALAGTEVKAFVTALENDGRAACKTFARQLEKREAAALKERERMATIFEYEKKALSEGYRYVAGLDEAGRGPLVGAVVAASVILNEASDWTGIDDSKKLTAEKREYFYRRIIEEAVSYGVGVSSHEEIDSINILNATKQAMKRALDAMSVSPDLLLIDAVKLDDIPTHQISIIKGDSKSASIAAASILAKVTRDRMMDALHDKYPFYGFDKHKGYGTEKHYEAIKAHGVTPEHRRTFLKGL